MNRPGLSIRVVKVPTTGELLDQYYRERNMIHGGGAEHDRTMPQGDGCRRVPARTGGRS